MKKERKTHRVGFALERGLRESLEKLAEASGVSLSTVVRWALVRYVGENGRAVVDQRKKS